MKAIIMAGGEGTRLRPVNNRCPKPMVRLLGRPVLEHLLLLLRDCGFTEICITLRYLPDQIRRYFDRHAPEGLHIEYRIEDAPRGTAGGVRACADFIGGDTVLVLSGDAVCDFDLRAFMERHRAAGALLSMALYAAEEPLPYGLVVTDRQHRIVSFIEKPDWEHVVTDLVNTGIYALSPQVLREIPADTAFDFARDLFPHLMEQGVPLYGFPTEGYWCDIGSPEAFLRCSMDALRGTLRLSPGAPDRGSGIFSADPLPEHIVLHPPCFLGEHVSFGTGAIIGPGAVIGCGSRISSDAIIRSSIIDGAFVGEQCVVKNSIVCREASVPAGSKLGRGSILAPRGADCPPARPARAAAKPRHPRHSRELPCRSRARLMRALSEHFMEAGADFTDGLHLQLPGGSVRIAPSSSASALQIETDTDDPAAAERLLSDCSAVIETLQKDKFPE